MRTSVGALTAGVVLLAATPAAAQSPCTPLPGIGGLDQYCESVPGASGPVGTRDITGRGGRVPSIPRATQRELERTRDGESVLVFSGETDDPRSEGGGRREGAARDARNRDEFAPQAGGGLLIAAIVLGAALALLGLALRLRGPATPARP